MKIKNSRCRRDNELPIPTVANPHAQLDWIFRDKSLLYSSKDTQDSYRSALAFYKRFLKKTNNYSKSLEKDSRFFLDHEWDIFALHKVKTWLDRTNVAGDVGYLSSCYVTTLISTLRLTMAHAYEHSYIDKPVINVPMREAVRETDKHTAYSLEEYEQIFRMIGPMIRFSKGLLNPYVPTGKGKDPRVLNKKQRRRKKLLGEGWRCWAINDRNEYIPQEDNVRWYFENVLNCVPFSATRHNRKHLQFFLMARVLYGGLRALYREWGVSYSIDSDVMMPLLVELTAETGLNVESVLSLKRDCFKEAHPLTGLPYLEYNKPRSGGEKELHTSLYDSNERNNIGLKQRQSRIISNSIQIILKLTEPLVQRARAEDKSYLFLYEPQRRTRKGSQTHVVQRLNLTIVNHWTVKLLKRHDLRADDGKPLSFNLSRFRPTKITELVAQGYDFFDIMGITGHVSINTTLSYIDKLKSAGDFHRKIEKALSSIKHNKQNYDLHPVPVAITKAAPPGKFIFKAPVCYCKNPYDPPEAVRRSDNYHDGDACSYFNMCLSCENVLITEANLPKLISYRNEVDRALGNISEIPRQGELYQQTRMILDQVLMPDVLFAKETLDWARDVARSQDYDVLDSFISRSTESGEA